MCGVPAKQNAGSSITVATIISSMLNSLWTMILLFCELWGCTDKGFCCAATAKHKNHKRTNVEDTDRNTCELNHRQDPARSHVKRQSKLCRYKVFLKAGKITVSIVIFIIFSTTFIDLLGFWTVCHVTGIYFFNVSSSTLSF